MYRPHAVLLPGAVANGLQEKELTLDIAKRIKRILVSEYEGVTVDMTRETDKYVSLEDRADSANRRDVDFFLSIHINAGGGTGFESFRYTNASSRSKVLQSVIHPEIVAALGVGVVDRGAKTKNLHVLRETKMPAMLTENLFIDNVQDARLLKDQDMLEVISRGHVVGMEKAFGLRKKPQKKGPFPKVPASDPAAAYIRTLADMGILQATLTGRFDQMRP